jgi:hypothetical protein
MDMGMGQKTGSFFSIFSVTWKQHKFILFQIILLKIILSLYSHDNPFNSLLWLLFRFQKIKKKKTYDLDLQILFTDIPLILPWKWTRNESGTNERITCDFDSDWHRMCSLRAWPIPIPSFFSVTNWNASIWCRSRSQFASPEKLPGGEVVVAKGESNSLMLSSQFYLLHQFESTNSSPSIDENSAFYFSTTPWFIVVAWIRIVQTEMLAWTRATANCCCWILKCLFGSVEYGVRKLESVCGEDEVCSLGKMKMMVLPCPWWWARSWQRREIKGICTWLLLLEDEMKWKSVVVMEVCGGFGGLKKFVVVEEVVVRVSYGGGSGGWRSLLEMRES